MSGHSVVVNTCLCLTHIRQLLESFPVIFPEINLEQTVVEAASGGRAARPWFSRSSTVSHLPFLIYRRGWKTLTHGVVCEAETS